MSEKRPKDLDELVEMLAGLADSLHKIVDMNAATRKDTWQLYKQVGAFTPEELAVDAETIESHTSHMHTELAKWEKGLSEVPYLDASKQLNIPIPISDDGEIDWVKLLKSLNLLK